MLVEQEASMPDKRQHRGPHPEDPRNFATAQLETLRRAVEHFSWLLSRGYAGPSALKLVGDRFQLRARQRQGVLRCSCSDQARQSRHLKLVQPGQLRGERLLVDGFNVLTILESSLGGGVILCGRDGACRDLVGLHGSWRRVEETPSALALVGEQTASWGVASLHWLIDRPVSNSGRVKGYIEKTAKDHGWDWSVEVVPDVDRRLRETPGIVATGDSAILDACAHWCNLAGEVVAAAVPDAWLVDLGAAQK